MPLDSPHRSTGHASRCEDSGISPQPVACAWPAPDTVFRRERRDSDSPIVQQVTWLTCLADNVDITTPDGLWDLVIRKSQNRLFVLQTGLITKPVLIPLEEGDEYVCISFKPGVFMPRLPGAWMLNHGLVRPALSNRTFWIDGERLEIPTFENAEGLAAELVKRRIITTDEVVARVVEGRYPEVSLRSVQRRFRRVLGLSPHHLSQIARAGEAVAALQQGKTAIAVAQELGYADQSHLIRSLKQIMGRTPGQVRLSGAS